MMARSLWVALACVGMVLAGCGEPSESGYAVTCGAASGAAAPPMMWDQPRGVELTMASPTSLHAWDSTFGWSDAVTSAALAPAPFATDPATMYSGHEHPVAWKKSSLPSGGHEFFWASHTALLADDKAVQLTIIAGSIGASGECLAPPLREGEVIATGAPLNIGHECGESPGKAEEVVLFRGALIVHVEKATRGDAEERAMRAESAEHVTRRAARPHAKQFPVWPLIVRAPSLPAGTYSGVFVLLNVPIEGKPSRRYVFRPNQANFELAAQNCDKTDTKGDASGLIVSAKAVGTSIDMIDASCVILENNASPPANSVDIPAEEARFLKDACKFYKDAMSVINSVNPKPAPWNFGCP